MSVQGGGGFSVVDAVVSNRFTCIVLYALVYLPFTYGVNNKQVVKSSPEYRRVRTSKKGVAPILNYQSTICVHIIIAYMGFLHHSTSVWPLESSHIIPLYSTFKKSFPVLDVVCSRPQWKMIIFVSMASTYYNVCRIIATKSRAY